MLITVLFVLFVQSSEVTVSVQTKDGSTLAGTLEPVTFSFESTLGRREVKLKDIAAIQMEGDRASLVVGDGSVLKGRLLVESWKLRSKLGEFTLKTAEVRTITVQAAPRVEPGPASPPKPEVTPLSVVKLGEKGSRLLTSQDGKKAYVLTQPNSKLMVVNIQSFAVEKEIELSGQELFLALVPGESDLLMAAGNHTVTSVMLSAGKVIKSFRVEPEVSDLCPLDSQNALIATGRGISTVSFAKQAVTSNLMGQSPRFLGMPDNKKVFTNWGVLLLPDQAANRPELRWRLDYSGASGEMISSSDWRYGVIGAGIIYKRGKSFLAMWLEVGRIDVHWGAFWAPGQKRLYTVSSTGGLRAYDTTTWECLGSWSIGFRIADGGVDDSGRYIYGIGEQTTPGYSGSPFRYPQHLVQGNLMKFELPK